MTPPVSPQAFANSLRARAANTSRTTGIPTRELLERYFHRRLLARVFQADGDGWVLKGGQALLVRWPKARYSTDVDLVSAAPSVEEAVTALLAAVETPLADHLRFEHHDTSREAAANRPSRKVRFKVMHGLRQLSMVSVDVVVAESDPVGEVLTQRLEAPFAVESGPWPVVRMWPLEDHVADKIAAMYERHGAGLHPSTRFKDLVDLVLIALNSPVRARWLTGRCAPRWTAAARPARTWSYRRRSRSRPRPGRPATARRRPRPETCHRSAARWQA